MSQSFSTMVRDGQDYMKTWPVEKELYAIFPECRVITATKLGMTVMPPIAVVTCALMINHFGSAYLPQALAIGAFFLSLPMQGLLWLGHRANQTLPPQLSYWYREIHEKMQSQGCRVQRVSHKPQYKELAALLKTAFDELDRVFTKNWF